MQLRKLRQLVKDRCEYLAHDDALGGGYGDGGSTELRADFEKYVKELIIKFDLRPSEISTLENIEIGEPSEFKHIIDAEKLKLISFLTLDDISQLIKNTYK